MTIAARGAVSSLLALATALTACSVNSADWFTAEWDDLRERGDRGELDSDSIPRPTTPETPSLPDFNGDDPIQLSIEEAVVLALRSNRDLEVALYNPVIAGAFERIERGRFDPEVFANAETAQEEALETANSTGQQFSVESNTSGVGAGVRQELPTGTSVELGVTQDRTNSDRAPEQQTARLGLSVTQSLLRGFGPAVNLAAIRQAQLEEQASRYELRGFAEGVLAETEVAYWRYLLALRTIEIFERSLDVAREQSEQVDQRIEVGVLAQTESAAARTEVAIREQALIDARSDLQAARIQLLRLLNAPLSAAADREITLASEPVIDDQAPGEAESRIELALQSRPDLNEARLRLDQGRLETIRTRNGLLPRLDLFIALGLTGYSDTFIGSFEEIDGRTYDYTFGVSLSQSIGRNTAKGQYEAALATRDQAAASIRNLEQLVEVDVRLALNNAERARQQIDATVTTRRLQEETVQAEIERFDVGASTTLLVAQAQRDLLLAQINEVEAVINYRIALIQLYLAEGSLLERRGVLTSAGAPNGAAF